MTDGDPRPYRKCVGIMMLNADGLVFVGDRINTDRQDWQMPQGGIEYGESPEIAALRELEEETGTDKVEIIGEIPRWISYDLPPDISRRIWGGRYRGQSQRWYAMRFTGEDDDIRLDRYVPEFCAWRWVPIGSVCELIIPFKRQVYREVVREFTPLTERQGVRSRSVN